MLRISYCWNCIWNKELRVFVGRKDYIARKWWRQASLRTFLQVFQSSRGEMPQVWLQTDWKVMPNILSGFPWPSLLFPTATDTYNSIRFLETSFCFLYNSKLEICCKILRGNHASLCIISMKYLCNMLVSWRKLICPAISSVDTCCLFLSTSWCIWSSIHLHLRCYCATRGGRRFLRGRQILVGEMYAVCEGCWSPTVLLALSAVAATAFINH